MRLSDIRGDAALDILADLIEPAAEIFSDKDIAQQIRDKKKIPAVKSIIKDHKRAVTEILAVLDGEDPETYAPNVLTLPIRLIEILNDPDLLRLFQLQGQNKENVSSGSAMVNTEGDDT